MGRHPMSGPATPDLEILGVIADLTITIERPTVAQ